MTKMGRARLRSEMKKLAVSTSKANRGASLNRLSRVFIASGRHLYLHVGNGL